MRTRARSSFWIALAVASSLSQPAAAVAIDWVTIGDPGNACDTQPQGCFGSVAGEYQISKFEVTVAQYTEFLNAVAASDPNGLYNTDMGDTQNGSITRSGSDGSYTYAPKTMDREDAPANYVSFWDALRFANWLHNGQPVGAQDDTTTEDGAYTITLAGVIANSIARNAGATVFLPSEDEWYKAAYHDAVSASYFDYPAGSDTQTVCAAPGAAANTANCGNVIGDLTVVGSYPGSPSPSGTFDQGGNVAEWNEAILGGGANRGIRGGDLFFTAAELGASLVREAAPSFEFDPLGFRVASVIPEPGTGVLVMSGLMALSRRRGRTGRRGQSPVPSV